MEDERPVAGIEQLAERWQASGSVAVLTGAGASTESGLPDYRGAGGLWKERRFEELANIRAWRHEPAEFWEFYRMRLDGLRQASPGLPHHGLAALEQAGLLDALITQNVDGLHEAAGSEPIELHGTLAHAACLGCGERVPADEARDRQDAATDGVPRCRCGAVLKPDVVLFGEQLPDSIDVAAEAAASCDLFVAMGTSLEVTPAGLLPLAARDAGAALAIINIGPTALDDVADLRLEARLGPAITQLCALLGVPLDGT